MQKNIKLQGKKYKTVLITQKNIKYTFFLSSDGHIKKIFTISSDIIICKPFILLLRGVK